MNKDKKYYVVRSKRLAIAIEFLSGLNYYVHDDRLKVGGKTYTFEDSAKLQEVLDYITNGRSKFRF